MIIFIVPCGINKRREKGQSESVHKGAKNWDENSKIFILTIKMVKKFNFIDYLKLFRRNLCSNVTFCSKNRLRHGRKSNRN